MVKKRLPVVLFVLDPSLYLPFRKDKKYTKVLLVGWQVTPPLAEFLYSPEELLYLFRDCRQSDESELKRDSLEGGTYLVRSI